MLFMAIIICCSVRKENHTNIKNALYIASSQGLLVSEQVVNTGAEFTSKHFTKARKESSGKTWNILASMLGTDGWSTSASGHFTPGNEKWCPLHRRLDGSRLPSVRTRKISPTWVYYPVGCRMQRVFITSYLFHPVHNNTCIFWSNL